LFDDAGKASVAALDALPLDQSEASTSASDNPRSSHYRYGKVRPKDAVCALRPRKTPTPVPLDSPPDEQRVLPA